MAEAPRTNWNMIHHWEWFRRAQWLSGFRAEKLGVGGGGECKAFAELAAVIDAKVALDCACGLGKKTLCMAEMGLNVWGSDGSTAAVEHARELAQRENAAVDFFHSAWADLPRNVPHYFDAIFCDGLGLEPEWDKLGAALVGIFHILKPGGFLMFPGSPEGTDANAAVTRMNEVWAAMPHERLDWFHRDGAVTACRITQSKKADNFVDDRLLYAVQEAGAERLESTSIRRPAYWTWNHWKDLTRMAGFCHLETRAYAGYGTGGEDIKLNVAWRSRDGRIEVDETGRNEPYAE